MKISNMRNLATKMKTLLLVSVVLLLIPICQANEDYDWSQIGGNVAAGTSNWRDSNFHVSISADGDTVAVGSPSVNDTNGLVRISRLNTTLGLWEQIGSDILGGGDAERTSAGFSTSLSQDGNLLAVGFPGGLRLSSYGNIKNVAKVYRWNQTSGDWEQFGSEIFEAANTTGLELPQDFHLQSRAGWSVSLSDDGMSVAVGAPVYFVKDVGRPGQVRVYQFNQLIDDWDQLGQELFGEASDTITPAFGFSVSLSGDGTTLAVGAPQNSVRSGFEPGSGYAEIWRLNATQGWEQLGFTIVGDESADTAGRAVSLSTDGETLAVGQDGLVRVYKVNNNSDWEQFGSDVLLKDGGIFQQVFGQGRSLSLSGDGQTVAVGAPGHSENCVIPGLASVFRFNGTDWEKMGSTIPGEYRFGADDSYGNDFVALSSGGSRLVVGAPFHVTDAHKCSPDEIPDWTGHVRVFDLVALTPAPSIVPSSSPSGPPKTSTPSQSPSSLPVVTGLSSNTASETPSFRPTSLRPTIEPTSLDTSSTVRQSSFNSRLCIAVISTTAYLAFFV